MKRKKNIISFLSSILGVFALCGLFGLMSLDNKDQLSVKAADVTLLYQNGINSTFRDQDNDAVYNFVGSYRYYLVNTNGEQKYQFEVRLRLYGTYYDDGDMNYYFTTNYNSESATEFVFYSDLRSASTNFIRIELSDTSIYDDEFTSPEQYFESDLHFYFYYDDSYAEGTYFETTVSGYTKPDNAFMEGTDLQFSFVNQSFTVNVDNIYDVGYADGYNAGYVQGNNSGSVNGYNAGYEQGLVDGANQQSQEDASLINQAHQDGYVEGYQAGSSEDETVSSIFAGIMSVAMVPIDFFLAIFNFEILGINISAMVTALLSLAITIIVIKLVTGKKGE